jgi:lipid-A-disaccharide synthase-like uncharacterized protein
VIWIKVVGFSGQALFAGRVLLQWIASERARRSVVPRGYWEISLAAAGLVLTYALLVNNFVFVLSTLPGALIAGRNLRIVRPAARRQLVPWAAALAAVLGWAAVAKPHVGTPFWATLGVIGSLLWGGRHLIQWWISERRGKSVLPGLFWIFSLVGSVLLVAYAISRHDPVMIVGYAFGCIPYLRNLMLLRRALTK